MSDKPQIVSLNRPNGRPVAIRPKVKRMAGSSTDIQQLLAQVKPWSETPGPNTWNNRTEAEFIANDRKLAQDVLTNLDRHKMSYRDAAEELMDKGFTNYEEAYGSVKDIDRTGRQHTRQVTMGVPNAAADEEISRLLLNVGRNNSNLVLPNNLGDTSMIATDNIARDGTMIDSQRRGISGALNLGILNNVQPYMVREARQNLQYMVVHC